MDENNEEQIIEVPKWAECEGKDIIDLSEFMCERDNALIPKLIQNTLDNLNVPDLLAELEEQILQYYLAKGYKLEKDQEPEDDKWSFAVEIKTNYKTKDLCVYLFVNGNTPKYRTFKAKTVKEMFDKAFEFFKIEEQDLCISCVTDKEKCFLAEGFEKVKACVKYEEDTNIYEILVSEIWQKTTRHMYIETMLPKKLNGVEQ